MSLMKQRKFADPTYNVASDLLFGNENNKHMLINLINSLLDFKGDDQVIEVELVPPDLSPNDKELKKPLVDTCCCTKKGETILVEIQIASSESCLESVQHDLGRLLCNRIRDPDDYFSYNNTLPNTYVVVLSKN